MEVLSLIHIFSEYESVKPSGGGVNDALTTEDQEAAKNGENFIIPDNAPAVRYIRFKTNDTCLLYTSGVCLTTFSFLSVSVAYAVSDNQTVQQQKKEW